MIGIDKEKHKKSMRMGIHFHIASMKGDQKQVEDLIKSMKKLDDNDTYAFMMGIYLTTTFSSNALSSLLETTSEELAKKITDFINEDDILDSVNFDAD